MRKTGAKAVLVVVPVLVVGLAVWGFSDGSGGSGFRTQSVKRGDLDVTISATGTIEPEEVVDVGAQVAGQIVAFGTDDNGKSVDYGSQVEEGTVLAKIDDAMYAADAAEAQAALARAQADLLQSQAKLVQAERDWQRAQKIGPSQALAGTTYDAYRSAYEIGRAQLAVSEASVAQAQAALGKAQRNLSYCIIKSPVKGVIIDRRVNIGQTVVSSLNAPSLFLIAKDLRRMQVWVAVNEADIGSIRPGQSADFTVDAFPDEIFEAAVSKIRLNATMTQNVVTYTVELVTDNASGRLLPYLTANVRFAVSSRRNVLLVPIAALHWLPKPEQVEPSLRSAAAEQGSGAANLWTPSGRYVKPVAVRVGANNGSLTEVEGAELGEGMPIVVGEDQAGAAGSGSVNPFAPPPLRGRAKQ